MATPRRRGRAAAMSIPMCALALAAGLSACGLGHRAAAIPQGAAIVEISHMAFQPATLEVRVGQPVAWKFEDGGVVHNVVGLSGPVPSAAHFRSPNQESGIWVHRFSVPGTYDYQCSLHTYMRGEIIVDS